MARADEIVDPTGGRQQARRRTFLRVALPLIVVGTVIVSILLIAFHSYRVNRNGALELSRQVLHALQSTVAEKVASYLEPAIRSSALIDDMLSHTARADRPVAFLSYADSMLRQVARVEAFYLANSDGSFFVVRRSKRGGTDTRFIHVEGGVRTVTVQHYAASGAPDGPPSHPADDFDPRSEDWFVAASHDIGAPVWSKPTLFRPTDKPVITVATGRLGEDASTHVAAVDVALDDLSRFVAGLRVGQTGHAVVVDGDGHLIASPLIAKGGIDPSDTHLDPATDPVMTEAWDRTRVLGVGARVVHEAGTSFVTISAPIREAAPGWLLLLAAPESDFAGFAVVGGRQNLLFSLVIVFLALVLASLAVRQGFRADRAGRLVREVRERNRDEGAALERIVASDRLLDPHSEAPELTEQLARLADARRAGIWLLSGDGRSLVCEDRFDREENGHAGGFTLAREELPRFIETVRAGEPIETADARSDERTAEFHRLAMGEIGVRALALVPVAGGEATRGFVAIEGARSLARARNLSLVVAGIAGLRAREAGRADDAAGGSPDTPDSASGSEDEQARAHETSLLEPGARLFDRQGTEIAIYPGAAIMVLQVSDPLTATVQDTASVVMVADNVASGAQEIARRFELPYLKILNHSIVAASGCSAEDDPAAAIRLADAAIAIRELCLREMEGAGLDAFFHIGIDVGRVVGRTVGRDPSVFNLWGDAVRLADLMASSAADQGTIQVTENGYLRLRSHFLFRPRGRFYMPRVGVARSFVLAGRR